MDTNTEENTAMTLIELLNVLKTNGVFILLVMVLGFLLTASYSLLVTPIYASEALIAPKVSNEQQSSGISSSLSNLTSFAGIGSMSAGATRQELAYRKLVSKEFFSVLYNDDEFVRDFFATKRYNANLQEVTYLDSEDWISSKPNFQKAYEDFHKDFFVVSYNRQSGLITLLLKNKSPELSSIWLTAIISKINNYVKDREKLEAENSLKYLRQRLGETNVIEVQRVIAALIQQKIQTLMLAEVSEEYLFDIVDKPFRPDYKSWPKRTQMTIIGTIASGFFAILLSIFSFIISGSSSIKFLKNLKPFKRDEQ